MINILCNESIHASRMMATVRQDGICQPYTPLSPGENIFDLLQIYDNYYCNESNGIPSFIIHTNGVDHAKHLAEDIRSQLKQFEDVYFLVFCYSEAVHIGLCGPRPNECIIKVNNV